MLKTQICVTRPQCVNFTFISLLFHFHFSFSSLYSILFHFPFCSILFRFSPFHAILFNSVCFSSFQVVQCPLPKLLFWMSNLIQFRSHVFCGLLSGCFSGHFYTSIYDGLSVALILSVCHRTHWNSLHLPDLGQISFAFNAFHFPAYIFATLNCISPNCRACSMHFLALLFLLSCYFIYFPSCYHIFCCTAWKTEVASSSETLGTVWCHNPEDFNP